jgi:hypothetical protein
MHNLQVNVAIVLIWHALSTVALAALTVGAMFRFLNARIRGEREISILITTMHMIRCVDVICACPCIGVHLGVDLAPAVHKYTELQLHFLQR